MDNIRQLYYLPGKQVMPDLDMTPTTIEVPKYLKADMKALAQHYSKPGHTTMSMKTWLIDTVAKEKKRAKL